MAAVCPVNMNDPVPYVVWDATIAKALAALGVLTWGDLVGIGERRLLMQDGFGSESLAYLKLELQRLALSLAADPYASINVIHTHLPWTLCGMYFIGCESFVKIGIATDLRARFRHLQLANPFRLELLAFVECQPDRLRQREQDAHIDCREHHHRLEWFRLEGEVINQIEAAKKLWIESAWRARALRGLVALDA